MTKKQKLELTSIGKDVRLRLEPRILLEDPARSYHAKHRVKLAASNSQLDEREAGGWLGNEPKVQQR